MDCTCRSLLLGLPPASCLPTPLTTAPAPSPSGPTINNKPFVDFGLDGGGGAGGAVTVVGGAGYRSGLARRSKPGTAIVSKEGIRGWGHGRRRRRRRRTSRRRLGAAGTWKVRRLDKC